MSSTSPFACNCSIWSWSDWLIFWMAFISYWWPNKIDSFSSLAIYTSVVRIDIFYFNSLIKISFSFSIASESNFSSCSQLSPIPNKSLNYDSKLDYLFYCCPLIILSFYLISFFNCYISLYNYSICCLVSQFASDTLYLYSSYLSSIFLSSSFSFLSLAVLANTLSKLSYPTAMEFLKFSIYWL